MRYLFYLLVLTVGCSSFRPGSYEDSHPELFVRDIIVDDGEALPEAEAKAVLTLIPGQLFDDFAVREDREKLTAYYVIRGFPQVEVSSPVVERTEKGVIITYPVSTGLELIIERMSITSGGVLSTGEIARLLGIEVGDRLDGLALETGKNSVQTVLADRGYVRADIDTSLSIHRNKADITFRLNEGTRAIVGSIEIVGLERVKELIARRELTLNPGSVFRPRDIYQTQNYLLRTGLFSSARVLVPGIDRGDDTLHVFIQLKEAKHRFVEGGFGYSTPELSPDRITSSIAFGHDNLWRSAENIRLELGVEREWTSDLWEQTAKLDYSEPWLRGLPLSGGVSLEYTYRSVRETNYRVSGFSFFLGRSWHDIQSVFLTYQFRSRDTNAGDDPSELIQEEIDRPITNSIEGSVAFDTRNSYSDPTRGILTRIQLGHAGTFLGGDWSFRKLFFDASTYRRIGSSLILALRGRFGIIKPIGNSPGAPEEERFRAGGAFSVRGFKEEALGPTDEFGDPIGGEKMVVANAELRIPIWRYLHGGIFFDIGQVWEKATSGTLSDLEPSMGLGIRYNTIIGPIRVDWGTPLRDGDGGRFYFTIGHAF